MQRQNMALLFTDMVDSTAVATSMAPEAAEELRRQHFDMLRQAIAENDGVEVKNLGDGIMAAFTSASSALHCAVRMQQLIEIDNRARPRAIGLRVGLSGGEVTFEDGDYFGDPSIEAARICAKCGPGQILTSDVVRLMAGRRGDHAYTNLGEMDLKGLPYAVGVLQVDWVPDRGADAVALPQRIAMAPAGGFVGRVDELAVFERRRAHVAAEGGCEVMVVVGEPGQGKTTLVTEAARQAHELGSLVLFGRADEHLGAPYQLFAQALGHFVEHAGDELLRETIGERASDLVRLVPSITSRFTDVAPSLGADTDSERLLMFAAVVATFSQLSKAQPIFLVLDDVQWADLSSLRMLAHLATAEQPMRVLVVATCRDEELPASHALVETLATLHRNDKVHRMDLGGLGRDEVVALMGAAGHHDRPDSAAIADEILRDTDGNAFFVTELLRHLADGSSAPLDGLPRSVQEVIAMRVGRLGSDDERVLRLAAVIGHEFDLPTLERLSEQPEHVLLDAMERAMAVGLVREVDGSPGTMRFGHGLIQRTIYDGLSGTRRAATHRQVALAIEQSRASERDRRMAELARHWSLTGRTDDLVRAVECARSAADAALAGLAPDVAHRHYTEAIAMRARIDEPDLDTDLDLAIGLGIAQRKIGSAAFRQTLLDACQLAADAGDIDRLVTAALNNSRGWSSAVGVIDIERVAVLEKALGHLSETSAERALVLAALCKELTYSPDYEFRLELADEAAAFALDCSDDAVAVRVLNDLALPLGAPHTLGTSLARTEVSVERAERLGDPVLAYFASMWRAQALHMAGDFDGRDEHVERAGAMATRLGEPTLLWSQMHNTAAQAMSKGDVALADEIAATALEFGLRVGEPDAETYYGIEQMVVCLQRGNMGDLTSLIEDTLASMPELGDAGRAALMMSHLEGGRHDRAVAIVEAAAEHGFDFLIDNSWIVVMIDHAEVTVELGLRQHAERLRAKLEPFADLIACTGVTHQGPVAHYLGGLATLIGEHDDADRYFAMAEESNRRSGDQFSAARTALWWGRAAAARGQHDVARGRLALARLIAGDHGYAMVAERANEAFASLV